MPVTVTRKLEANPKLHDSVKFPEPVKLVGATLHAVLFVAKLTTPAKPFNAVTAPLEVPAEPALTATVVGLAEIVKS